MKENWIKYTKRKPIIKQLAWARKIIAVGECKMLDYIYIITEQG